MPGRGTIFASRVDVALADVQRTIVTETWLSHTACIMVCERVGVTLVDAATASEFVGRGLTIRPFSVEVDDSFVAIRLTQRPRSDLADAFAVDFLAHYADRYG